MVGENYGRLRIPQQNFQAEISTFNRMISLDDLFGTQTLSPPDPPVLPYNHYSSLKEGFAIPYKYDYSVANLASVNFILAFMTLATQLRDNAKKTSPTPPLSNNLLHCNFEDGWCPGFVQVNSEKIKWQVASGPSKTDGTGPNVDHTLKTAAGHYALMEAKGHNFGDSSTFRTLAVNLNDHEDYCLRYWYLLRGRGIGGFKVYWNVPKTHRGFTLPRSLVYSISGSKSKNSSHWIEKWTTLASPKAAGHTKPVHFEFQATRGFLVTSNVAIDDLSLSTGPCKEEKVKVPGTTPIFRPPTTPSGPKTTQPWQASNPDYAKCGTEWFNTQNNICCRGKLTHGGRQHKCCGEKSYMPTNEICCGTTPVRRGGCCGGSMPYDSNYEGCCGRKVYNKNKQICSAGKIEKKN